MTCLTRNLVDKLEPLADAIRSSRVTSDVSRSKVKEQGSEPTFAANSVCWSSTDLSKQTFQFGEVGGQCYLWSPSLVGKQLAHTADGFTPTATSAPARQAASRRAFVTSPTTHTTSPFSCSERPLNSGLQMYLLLVVYRA